MENKDQNIETEVKVETPEEQPVETVNEEKVETPEVVRDTFNSPVEIESEDALFEKVNNNQVEFFAYYNKVKKTSSTIKRNEI